MLFVRTFALALKPALAGSAIVAAAAGGWFAIDSLRGDSLTPFQAAQEQGQRLLVSEFGDTADTIVSINPDDVADRDEIARINHAPGYGVFASLSPDGGAIAYTALPEDEPEPHAGVPAIAGVVYADGETSVLANDVDLLITPVWSPDAASIVVRKNVALVDSAGAFSLVRLALDGTRTELASRMGTALFPIAYSPDGATFYYSTLDATGSDLWRVDASGGAESMVAHLSDEIARDWTLSPDGGSVAYSVAESGETPRIVTMTVDVATGAVAEAIDGADQRIEFNPQWDAAGELTIASVDADGAGGDTIYVEDGVERPIIERDAGIDLPLSWSPDGEALAVRSVEGPSTDAAASHVEIVAVDGGRERVSDSADVLIVGWME